jgi:propanol-preferring alcohol dehydrogenase
MKAMVLYERKPIEESPLVLKEIIDPEPGKGEVRVKIKACGVCRTDLHVIEGELPPAKTPIIPGHEIVGIVDRLGEGSSRFKIGDRIGIAWLRHTCGTCIYCQANQENLCENSFFTGYHADGGYAEYAVVPQDFAYPIPEIFSDSEATPLLCAGIVSFHALRRSRIKPGERLGLYGFGSSAHIIMQVALHWGCKTFVATRGEEHKKLAKEMGAVWVGDVYAEFPEKMDSSIIFAPAGELVPPALHSLRKGGTLALGGIYMTPIPSLDYEKYIFYERDLRSVTANTRQDGIDFLKEASEIPIKPTITTFPLEEANTVLQIIKGKGLKGTGVLIME